MATRMLQAVNTATDYCPGSTHADFQCISDVTAPRRRKMESRAGNDRRQTVGHQVTECSESLLSSGHFTDGSFGNATLLTYFKLALDLPECQTVPSLITPSL